MSRLVAHMGKMKSPNLTGMQWHNQRQYQNHTNKEIDKSRSYLNYDLVNAANINYKEKIMAIIESQKEGSRAIRKDAVLVNEWIITSDQDFFRDLPEEKRADFFKYSTEWFQERYGRQNVVFAQVHLDETTPHMHLGVVPMRDGKLQGKNVFTKKELFTIQAELPKYLQSKGFEIDRGEERSKAKHLTVPEYKEMVKDLEKLKVEKESMALETSELAQIATEKREEVKVLSDEFRYIESEYKTIKDGLSDKKYEIRDIEEKVQAIEINRTLIKNIPFVERKNFLGKSLGIVEVKKEDWEKVISKAELTEVVKRDKNSLEQDNIGLKIENSDLRSVIKNYKHKNDQLKKENNELKKEVSILKKTIEALKDMYREKMPELANIVGYAKAFVLDNLKEKLIKNYFTDDKEIQGAQKFLEDKKEQQQNEPKQSKIIKNDSGIER